MLATVWTARMLRPFDRFTRSRSGLARIGRSPSPCPDGQLFPATVMALYREPGNRAEEFSLSGREP